MNYRKSFISAFAALSMIMPVGAANAKDSAEISVLTGGNRIVIVADRKLVEFSDAEPFIDSNDRTMIPVRAVAQTLDCDVSWDENSQAVTVTDADNEIVLVIGSKELLRNGEAVEMDTAAVISNDRTYIPLRFLAEALGYDVNYTAQAEAVVGYETAESGEVSDLTSVITLDDEGNIIEYYGYETGGDSTENTNPHGLFGQDFNVKSPTPLTDVWYTGDDIPSEISDALNGAVAYHAADVTSTDDESYDPVTDSVLDLETGTYYQSFWFDGDISSEYFTETLFKTSTGRIAVRIESDAIASDDLWIDLDLYKISEDGESYSFVEAWHQAFDDVAVVVFDDLDTDGKYSLAVNSVNYIPKEFSGEITICSY